MSIIIRLQNLPLSAKTGDIRKFFGGLRIPDGGVHILGGDKGDAFIAFMSDEDGRLAMRKDGGRINDSRVKLFLSSRMEMQHELEKITKGADDPPFFEEGKDTRNRSRERRKRSRSPPQYSDRNFDKSRSHIERQRSISPVKYSTKRISPARYRSRSPRISRSPKLKSHMPKRKSVSPKNRNLYSLSPGRDFSHFSQKISEQQAELERRIVEVIEKNDLYKKALREEEEESNRLLTQHPQHLSFRREPEDMAFYADHSNSNMHYFKDPDFKPDYSVKKERLPLDLDSYYIILEGMDPNWNFREVQIMLKGHYAPQNSIRTEIDDSDFKSSRAIVKLTNRDDFYNILKKSPIFFKGKQITVRVCPEYIVQNYFPSNSDPRNAYGPQNHDMCYVLKGLPFSCKYDDVVAFFSGLEVSDVLIKYGDDGKATGTGFVSFRNWNDFKEAFSQNGKKIGRRYIEMLPCTAKEMAEAKRFQQGDTFIPYSQILSEKRSPSFRRPICAILTGLPFTVTKKKILDFFSEAGLKPDAIHLTLGKKKLSDGRAFLEFSNYMDFDLALKFHGKVLDNHIICVKQILYDEMVKILDSQKAKHYFASTDPSASVLAEPEKVPYLWEPPDEKHDKDFYSQNSRAFLPSDKLKASTSFSHNKNITGGYPPDDISRRDLDTWYSSNTSVGSFSPMYPSSSGLDVPYDKEFMSALDDDYYYSIKKYEENIKSSRLSPENEAALLDFLSRDREPFSGKRNRGFKSFERRGKKYFKPRPRDDIRDEARFEIPSTSNPLHYNKAGGCTVQLSNVDVSVGSKDLLNFLRGFEFVEDTLIRRYTSDNIPTPDVRVTFINEAEAERAVRILSKKFLLGKPVDVFFV